MEHNYNRPSKKLKTDTNQAQSWARTLENNKTLLHLDFSHNNMDRSEIKLIGRLPRLYYFYSGGFGIKSIIVGHSLDG